MSDAPVDGVPLRPAPTRRKVFGLTVITGSAAFLGAAVAVGLAGLWVAMMATVVNGDEDGSALFHIPIILAFFAGRWSLRRWWQVRAGWSTLAPATLPRRVGLGIALAALMLVVVAAIAGGGWWAIDSGALWVAWIGLCVTSPSSSASCGSAPVSTGCGTPAARSSGTSAGPAPDGRRGRRPGERRTDRDDRRAGPVW